jgi:tetratricopeptide (TPR) repeat protein
MASTVEKIEGVEKISAGEQINDFLQKNRRALAFILAAVVVLVIAFVAVLSVRDALNAKALAAVAEFNRRYEALRLDINEESKAGEVEALLEELAAFEAKTGGFAAARAYAISAGIYGDKKDWAEAGKAWTAAARAAPKSYLAPAALYNAAVAAEEQENIDGAIALYNESLAYGVDFSAGPRAQFSIGRLEEGRNNKEAALEAYRALVSKWPNEAIWPSLAQSRIIILGSP